MNDYTTPASILAITGSGKIGNQSSYKNDSNEAFLGEKFQFSSVLKSTVDSVEKTYSDAQNPKKPIDSSQKTNTFSSEQDAFIKNVDDEIAPSKSPTLENSSTSKNDVNFDKSEDNSTANDQTDLSSDGKNSASSGENSHLTSSNEQNAGKVFGENQEGLAANENASNVLSINQKGDVAGQSQITSATTSAIDKAQVQSHSESGPAAPTINTAAKVTENNAKSSAQAPENNGQGTSKTSGEVLSSATLSKKTPEFSDDINKIALKNIKEGVAAQKAPSATSSNTSKQEQDLSNRLKNNPMSPVKVSVDNNGDKMGAQAVQTNANQLNAMPSHTKAPTAQLAELSLEEGQASLSKSTNGKLTNPGDIKASNHHSITTNSNVTSQSQQANAMNESQMLRQQAASIGAQQSAANQSAMAPKASMAVDIPGISGAAGPNNQTQQVTKVVAPPPPPPPPKPPAPVEQVAVQIKKAIGEGADKINIKLQPANLGKVEVRMEIGKDGVLTANVIAEKPETLELLQRDVRGLEKVLQEGGLKTDTQSFNFSLKEHAQQQAANRREETNEQPDNNNQNSNEEEAEDAETTASEAVIYGQNTATNGGVNIMI
ncbi:MAG TPA: flagellar hook-length control protein FliK [Rhodospirillales bacterium]|nr:flagellar hook-length control protein FliK [Rhodospirillales bacterium]